ncbi:MAG TPA: hypothetical protein VKK79_02025, partial [Candidatus Lokiarchaeia archaeon]|nr:hypothetical protein [Candidatus Lokiarchaeia archaeon]
IAAYGSTSPIIAGYIFGDLCVQVVLASNGSIFPQLNPIIQRSSRISSKGIKYFTPSFMLVIIFVISIINVNLETDVVWIALCAGLLLAAAGMVLTLVQVLRGDKKREEKTLEGLI